MNKKVNIIMYTLFIVTIFVLSFLLLNKKDNSEINISSKSSEYTSQIEELNKTIESKNNEINTLNNKVLEHQNSIDSLKSEKVKKEEELNDLTETYNELLNSKSSTTKTIVDTKEINKLKTEIENKKKEIENINNSINEKEISIASLQEEIKTLKETFIVMYVSDSGLVAKYNVKKGENVPNVPSVPKKNGYNGTWNRNGNNITDNTVIVATYTPKTYNIYYDISYTTDYEYKIATFELNENKYFIEFDYDTVFKYEELIGELNNQNEITIDSKEFELDYYRFKEIVEKDSLLGNTYGEDIYLDRIFNYNRFNYNDKSYLYDSKENKVYLLKPYTIEEGYIFKVDNMKYIIGGNESKIYYDDSSISIKEIIFNMGIDYFMIKDNKVYDNTETEITTISDNKFTYDSIEYTINTHFNMIRNIIKNGTYKNENLLPKTYTYGDRYIILPNIDDTINGIDNPRSDVYSSEPNYWKSNLYMDGNRIMLLDDIYGDIYVYAYYIDWN